MTTMGAVWVVGTLPSGVLISARMEYERRTSSDAREREAVLVPGLVGIVGGLCWPLVAAVLVVLAVLWVMTRCGRTIVDMLGVRDG